MGISEIFIKDKEVTSMDILSKLFDGDKDLDLKTHLVNPKDIVSLILKANDYKKNELTKDLGVIVEDWVKEFQRKMVSWNRLSRDEGIRGVIGSELSEKEKEEF